MSAEETTPAGRPTRRAARKAAASGEKAATAEPPVMQVLDVLCHNELLRAMGCADGKEQVAVTRWQRQTAHFFNFGTHRLAKGGWESALAACSRSQ